MAPAEAVGRFEERELGSFDGGVCLRQRLLRPDRYRQLEQLPKAAVRITRGGGFSYAAAGIGGGGVAVDARAFDRLLEFDPASGVLECEAGATLGRVHEVASPAGWHLPVQPGYPAITVGGCVACDVHGKNPLRDGTFRTTVTAVRLFHPSHGHLLLDRTQAPELLDLTCGGLGLTGHIVSVRLQLSRIPGSRVRLRRVPVGSLPAVAELLDQHAGAADFVYSWQDLMRGGAAFGRGVLYVGDFLAEQPPAGGGRRRRVLSDRLEADGHARWGLPVFNRPLTRAFNRVYGLTQALGPAERRVDAYRALFPVARKTAYFRLFGRRGFHEYQLLVPRDAFPLLAEELQRHLARHPAAVTLGSCKSFGSRRRSLLRFEGPGVCLALDFARDAAGSRLAAFLDQLLPRLGAIPNVFKDSRLPRGVAEACYGEGLEQLRRRLREFDPQRLFRSELSERLGL